MVSRQMPYDGALASRGCVYRVMFEWLFFRAVQNILHMSKGSRNVCESNNFFPTSAVQSPYFCTIGHRLFLKIEFHGYASYIVATFQ